MAIFHHRHTLPTRTLGFQNPTMQGVWDYRGGVVWDPFMGDEGFIYPSAERGVPANAPSEIENPLEGLRRESILPDGLPSTLPPWYSERVSRATSTPVEITKDLTPVIIGRGKGEAMTLEDQLRLETYFCGNGVHPHRLVLERVHSHAVDPLARAMEIVAYYEKDGKLSRKEYAILYSWMFSERTLCNNLSK